MDSVQVALKDLIYSQWKSMVRRKLYVNDVTFLVNALNAPTLLDAPHAQKVTTL